ncbi:lasso RiPP family leader peptide-containing protein [Kineococcus gynurae]|uniref:Lasso RiPP family leader peptide-containing protein n=1 Tax=Kineococcus gynurae TaxID=452979 RepID=A0ABV5LWP3_9ACTN
MSAPYEKPRVTVLGSFGELTLATPKDLGSPNDGFSFRGQDLFTVS